MTAPTAVQAAQVRSQGQSYLQMSTVYRCFLHFSGWQSIIEVRRKIFFKPIRKQESRALRFAIRGRAMENQDQVSADTTSPAAPSQPNQTRLLSPSRLPHLARAAAAWPHQAARLIGRALRDDWRTHKYALWAALLLLLTTAMVVAAVLAVGAWTRVRRG